MRIRVLFFGVLKDIFQCSADSVTLPEGSTLEALLQHYKNIYPDFRNVSPSIAMSVNQAYARHDAPLHPDDEVALLPPVSGGCAGEKGLLSLPRLHCALVHEEIRSREIANSLRSPHDGAVAVFEGIVRNNSRGRSTLYLDYEAYEPMALKEMRQLASEALEKFEIRDVALVHRLGRLDVGETSVLIAVSSSHRGPAFEGCRWIIDTLKKRVPIWKKEYFEDGVVWADGEPFPASMPPDLDPQPNHGI